MDNNKLLKIFDVDDSLINYFDIFFDTHTYIISMTFKSRSTCCNKCGSVHIHKKGFEKRILVSNPINGFPSRLHVKIRRYKCVDCSCTFFDPNPVGYKDWNFTRVAISTILDKLKPYTSTYASVAKEYGVSTTRIMQIFDTFVSVDRKPLPRILDEFHFSRQSKYMYPAILMNFENKLIIDIIESRRHEVLADYLFKIKKEERSRVEYICIDMSYIFKPLLKTFFPNATLLVDHFHVIKMINDQLNNTRKRIQRKYAKNKHSVEYRLLKHRYKLLLTSRDKIDEEIFRYDSILKCHITMNGVLEKLIQIDDDLYRAYQAKEEYLLFDSINQNEINQHNLEKELKSIIKKFRCSGVEESIEVAKMLER